MEYEEIDSSSKTIADYQNFRNVLFQQWQELNNANVEYRVCAKTEKRVYKKLFTKCYLKFYGQIMVSNKLNHLTKEQRKFLAYYYKYPEKINPNVARMITKITRELMESYGVFDIGKADNNDI